MVDTCSVYKCAFTHSFVSYYASESSIQDVEPDLRRIRDPSEVQMAVHVTTESSWAQICRATTITRQTMLTLMSSQAGAVNDGSKPYPSRSNNSRCEERRHQRNNQFLLNQPHFRHTEVIQGSYIHRYKESHQCRDPILPIEQWRCLNAW